LTATILPKSKYRPAPQLEWSFYIENRSGKKIVGFNLEDPAVDGSDYVDGQNVRTTGGTILPGEFSLHRSTGSIDGKSFVYRVRDVRFADGTEWNAKPFNAARTKKSAPVKPTAQKSDERSTPKRILTQEWSFPLINDRVLKAIDAEPVEIESIKVQTRLHLMKPERLDMVEICNEQSNVLERSYNDEDHDIISFTTYEIKGKTFAYVIPYYLVEAENQYDIGVGMQNIYVDDSGSGTFKLLCNDDETDLKTLPQWVKDLAENDKDSHDQNK
jgi:hypothetical protein